MSGQRQAREGQAHSVEVRQVYERLLAGTRCSDASSTSAMVAGPISWRRATGSRSWSSTAQGTRPASCSRC